MYICEKKIKIGFVFKKLFKFEISIIDFIVCRGLYFGQEETWRAETGFFLFLLARAVQLTFEKSPSEGGAHAD